MAMYEVTLKLCMDAGNAEHATQKAKEWVENTTRYWPGIGPAKTTLRVAGTAKPKYK